MAKKLSKNTSIAQVKSLKNNVTRKFVKGGPGDPIRRVSMPATAADSALVANRANEVLDFYKNNPTYETSRYTIPFKTPPTPAYFAEKLNSAKESHIARTKEADPYMAAIGQVDRNGKVTFTSIPKVEDYYQDLGDNKFLQKEITNGAFNTDAPMSLYDRRIHPQKLTLFDLKPEFEKDFSFPDENGNIRIETMGDHVEVLTYDPLATTPWNQLSKTDKIKRLKDFGESGSPYKNAKEGIEQLTRKNPNEQRVVFNTDKGDIYKVQDIKTKRLIRYEDADGNIIDIDNPNGTPANEFYDRGKNAQPNANPGKEVKIIKTPKFATGGFKYNTGGPGRPGGPGKPNNPLLASPDVATAADSSFVAKNANNVHNFYTRNGYQRLSPAMVSHLYDEDALNINEIFEELEKVREGYKRFLNYARNVEDNSVVPYNEYTNYKPGNHRFEQRELTTGQINTKAPRSIYDDRIMPQNYEVYQGRRDIAEVASYDKLAVTPWNELTDAQKLKRLQKYGGSGTPFDGQTKKEALENYKNPVPAHLDMKEATGFPVPQVEIKPQVTDLPIPKTTKQRVIVNTPQGDKVKVQDAVTKKFLGWEDTSGESLDFEEYKPTGLPSKDFPEMKRVATPKFAEGGFNEDGKWKDKYKSKDGNYLTKTKGEYAIQTDSSTRRTLKGFITGAPKPNETPVRIANAKFKTGGENYTKNMLNANSTTGPRSEQSWQDPGVDRFSGNTNGVKAAYYLKKGGLKSKVSSKFNKLKK